MAIAIIESLTDSEEKRQFFEKSIVSLRVDRGVQMAMTGEVTQMRTNGTVLKEMLIRESNAALCEMPFDEETMRAIPYVITAIQECLLGGG